jgi:hypothetical protein
MLNSDRSVTKASQAIAGSIGVHAIGGKFYGRSGR